MSGAVSPTPSTLFDKPDSGKGYEKEAVQVESIQQEESDSGNFGYEKGSVDVEAGQPDSESDQGDAVFGKEEAGQIRYKSVGLWQSAVLLCKTQIGLGVLTIPGVFASIGVVPGVLSLLALAGFTTYANYTIGTFKLRHRSVHTVGDVGEIMGGAVGKEIVGVLYLLLMIFIAGAAFLAISIALNAVSTHATCTMVFVVVATIVSSILASLQTLSKVSVIGWIGLASIVASVVTLTVAVGVQGRPFAAPVGTPIVSAIFVDAKFSDAMNALGNIVFSYSGTPAFMSIIAEMKKPEDYTKAMLICQGFVTVVYLVIGLIVYHFAGNYVSSPALASAGLLFKKICYGLAIPALLASAVIFTHLAAKAIFVRVLRSRPSDLKRNTKLHYLVWGGAVASCAGTGFLLAAAIPAFSGLIGIIGSVLGSFFSLILPGGMWFFDNWHHRKSPSLSIKALALLNGAMIISGAFLVVAGTYGSVLAIIASLSTLAGPFSCADNSL